MGVIVPREDGQAVFGLELVTVRGVVDNDDVLHAATDTLHVLHELVVVKGTVLAKQPLRSDIISVKDVHERDGIL